MRYNVYMRTNALWSVVSTIALFGVFLFAMFFYTPWLFFVYAQEEEIEEVLVEESNPPVPSDAPPYAVLPVVTNEKAKPRDIIKKELTITNNTERRVDLYITVKNIDPLAGDQVVGSPAESDLSSSLANWVEITRGVVELGPRESRKIPYLIHVNLTAKPGSYFARIAFHKGSNRAQAEATETDAKLILNLEVVDDAKERLQLGGFTADSAIVFGESVGFSYKLDNVGNREIAPRGSIRIFNRRGEEVGSMPLNADGQTITPQNSTELANAWTASGRFGKYKAYLDLEYGENQLASVQDTVYFWVFPWKEILFSLIGVLILAIAGTYVVHLRAMARPVPARPYHPEPNMERYMPAYHEPRAHVVQQPSRVYQRDMRDDSTTVLPSRNPVVARAVAPPVATNRESSQMSLRSRMAQTPSRNGATVTLGGQRRAVAQGNTVQLARR